MAETLPRDHGRNRLSLVGRTHELALLRERLTAAVARQGSLVLLGGEAGIGKSTLVETIAHEATAANCLVLSGNCYDLTATPPYGPWQGLTAHGSASFPAPLAAAIAATSGSTEVGGQAALFAGVRDGLAAAVAEQPVVVVLEDMHWTDPASLDLLRVVMRRPGAVPILMIVTYRVDELTRRHPLYQMIPILVREAGAERIDLRRLDEGAVRTLVTTEYPLSDANTARLVAYLQGHAEGNPLYTRELLRTLEEEGVLRSNGNGLDLRDLSRIRVPILVQQVIEGRVARLGETSRETLGLAAVIGQDVSLDLWSAVGGLSDDVLLATVEQAVEASLLTATERGAGVRFTHALIREALYEGVLPLRRRIWHRKVAEVLAETPGADPDAVAYHFDQAGDRRAWEWFVRAGERAQRTYAWLTAVDRFTAAVAALEGDTEQAGERGWLLYRIGRLLRMSDSVKSIAYLDEAIRVASAVDDPVLSAYATFDRGTILGFVGEIEKGIAAMEAGDAALVALPATAPARPDIAAWIADALPKTYHDTAHPPGAWTETGLSPRRGTLVMWLGYAGRFGEAQSIAERYLAQVALAHDDVIILASVGDAEFGLGMALAALGDAAAAKAAFRRARAAHLAIDHHVLAGVSSAWELMEVVLPYQPTKTGERQRLVIEVADSLALAAGALPPGQWTKSYYVEALLLDGAWQDAGECLRLTRIHADWSDRHFSAPFLAQLARWQGDDAKARVLAEEALPKGLATEPGDEFFDIATAMQCLSAGLAIDDGDLPLARTWIETHDRWLAWSGAVRGRAEGCLLWARYHRVSGDLVSAERLAAEALALATEPEQALAKLAAHRLLGEIATDNRRWTEVDNHLQASLALAEACAAPFERALTLLAFADLEAARGASDEALVLLDEVRAICIPLDARPTLARADAVAAQIAVPVTTRHPAGLSEREVEVLRLVARGMTNAEIADALFVSHRTVTTHLTHVFAKLNVTSRAGATRFAVEHGLT